MDLTWLSALIVGAALGYCIGTRRSKPVVAAVDKDIKTQSSKSPLEIEKLADILDDFKMVVSYIFLSTVMESQNCWIEFCILRFWWWEMILKWVKERLQLNAGDKLIMLSFTILSV